MSGVDEKIRERPSRRLRLVFRVPILFYRIGLGWVFGERFLMLINIGRTSGLKRQVVLEVLYHNRASGEYYVLSGWGAKSDWFRNIMKNPEVVVNVGGKRFEAIAFQTTFEEARDLIARYAHQHPGAFRILSRRILGAEFGVAKTSYESLAARLPVICLQPI